MTNYCSRYLIRVSWLERHLDMVEVPGSSPVTPTIGVVRLRQPSSNLAYEYKSSHMTTRVRIR